MKIIGAGLPKTGTKSIAAALKHFGYSVHDFGDHWQFYNDEYIAAFKGKIPNFKEMYQHVDAVTDVPADIFYKEIFKAIPDSKVVLAVRDSEEIWRKSLQKTLEVTGSVCTTTVMNLGKHLTPTGRKWNRLMMCILNFCVTEMDYQKHIDDAKAMIPADQLLIFNCKEGWEPLCAFLGIKEVPKIPFPHENVGSEDVPNTINNIWSVRRMKKELLVVLALFVGMIACACAVLASL
ncbi:uncharacterized protein LOC116619069 [Nematostella vectensis]|uniref:uncharacterized protein LOC116619069 n=1 Tax=Nematostella vectensis TaxID=45351 RepID=UPI001390208E|nr:uncharacterized protein LOC116619069 [Nematostella vectensis]